MAKEICNKQFVMWITRVNTCSDEIWGEIEVTLDFFQKSILEIEWIGYDQVFRVCNIIIMNEHLKHKGHSQKGKLELINNKTRVNSFD